MAAKKGDEASLVDTDRKEAIDLILHGGKFWFAEAESRPV